MKTTIKGGLPCLAVITEVSGRYVPARIDADPDSCYEAEYPTIAFELQTLSGQSAGWLRKAATEDDLMRIENELMETL